MPEAPLHQNSSWISFLRQFGPIPQNENSFDERIEASIRRWKVAPIKVELDYLQELVENFRSDSPHSIILTGTAGDGKTFYCREVWRLLQGDQSDWNPDAMVQELKVGKLTLIVIKDLSEITGEEKKKQLSLIADTLAGLTDDTLYLIAANDGQLLEGWSQLEAGEQSRKIRKEIEDLLVSGRRRSNKFNFELYNLSRTTANTIFPKVLKAILEHPGWDQCTDCQYLGAVEGQNPCPIFENKTRLEGTVENRLVQQRVSDLLELSELNGFHLPIRQMLILVANTILGHAEAKDGLMSCKEVSKLVRQKSISKASLYRNIFGENLPERRRDSKEVFKVLRRFGIGTETSNFIDNILIFGGDDPELKGYYEELLLSDPYYGADSSYRTGQQAYLEGGEDRTGDEFLRLLTGQRQRLFFTVPERLSAQLRLWQLTTFHYADEYLNDVHRALDHGEKVKADILARLVRGLNRIFTGILLRNDKQLILATSGSFSQARVSLVYEDAIPVRRNHSGEGIQIEADLDLKRPLLVVNLSQKQRVGLPLNLRRYEYLSRIAEGSLPNSFSRECYEDILAFKTSLLRQLTIRRGRDVDEDDSGRLTLNLISRLNSDGLISDPYYIEVKMQ
jgi:Cdc6-like AAA superfamily ATPase